MAGLTYLRSRYLTVVRILSVLAFFAAWELVTRAGAIKPFLLPGPVLILEQLQFELASGDLVRAVQGTLFRMFAGYAIAIAIGVPFGILLARVWPVRWFFDPLLSIALPMPQIAFLPIFILWLGVGDVSKIALIVFSAIFPIIVQTWAGTRGIDKYIAWSAQSLGVSKRAFLWEIALPAAMPQIFTGLQIALPIALLSTIVTEMLLGGSGIGGSIINGMRMSDSPELFGGIVAVGVLGFVLNKTMDYLRRRVLFWHEESQNS
jgi:ABC-type nitrate/sulfonate/bicarbonate transport system permease component